MTDRASLSRRGRRRSLRLEGIARAVLDVACGTGRVTEALLALVPRGRVLAIDRRLGAARNGEQLSPSSERYASASSCQTRRTHRDVAHFPPLVGAWLPLLNDAQDEGAAVTPSGRPNLPEVFRDHPSRPVGRGCCNCGSCARSSARAPPREPSVISSGSPSANSSRQPSDGFRRNRDFPQLSRHALATAFPCEQASPEDT
jgi:hypothetical protein